MGMTVAEIGALLRDADEREFEALSRSLAADERKGVRRAVEAARRRLASEAAERERIAGLYAFDREFRSEDGFPVGLDEVGRGALAGPLAVGAVVLRDEPRIPRLNDSKQLVPDAREQIAAQVREQALAWTVFSIEPHEIDRDGMARSLRRAFLGALSAIEEQGIGISTVLVDGNPLGIDPREHNVVKGDATSASIAAASIVAKVARDALMREMDSTYPHYGFSDNKGYGSPEHIAAIREHGPSPLHRTSFCRSFMQEQLFSL